MAVWHPTDSRSEDVRLQASQDLKSYVSFRTEQGDVVELTRQITSYSLEFPGDDGRKNVWKDVFHRIFDLTKSNHTYERLGAISAIGVSELGLSLPLTVPRCHARARERRHTG